MAAGAEKYKRRRHPRQTLSLTVGIHTAAGRSFGTLYDISQTGAFVALDPPPGAGARLTLTIRMHDGSELALPAFVRHSMGENSPKLVSGVGIEFKVPDEKTEARLAALIERLRKHEDPRAG
jgi:hypothetical protein